MQSLFDQIDEMHRQAVTEYIQTNATRSWTSVLIVLYQDEAGALQRRYFSLFGQGDEALRRRLTYAARMAAGVKLWSATVVQAVISTRIPKRDIHLPERVKAAMGNPANQQEEMRVTSLSMEGQRSDWHAPILRSLDGYIALGPWYATEPGTQRTLDYFYAEYLRQISPLVAKQP